ncbi:MAG: proton-conducting transporter membrane subunit, partial [bacterium]
DGQPAATKALVIVGLSDFALLLGVALLVVRGGWIDLVPPVAMRLSEPSAILAFLLVAVGALAKAGSMPLHSWIPTASETSPATVMALVPASLDKLLGIYLLTRLSVYVFDISSNMTLRTVFMAVGSVTVLAAVIMALVQKRVMRLLAFHAVSQVGYMVIGIGTGVPVGIAGGLFHMLNNALYKTGLFLTAGSVYSQSKTDKIDELGGLAGKMPLTFATFLLCSLAIAGVPPLNGFVSKWMVYQGIIDTGLEGNRLYPVFLVAAMLGSVLTLASFLKLLHAIFLGQRPRQLEGAREVGFAMWLPSLLIALACVAFGVLAFPLALRPLIFPALPFVTELQGIWQPALASLLLLVGLGIGAVLYLLGTVRRPVTARTYVGGETLAEDEEGRVTGTAFYTPVKGLPVMGDLLRFGELGAFDLFNWVGALLRTIGQLARAFNRQLLDRLFWAVGALARYTGGGLSYVQNGFLPLYVAWVFVGAVILYVVVVLGR